jgi:ParB family chromosome partitioning protein
LLQFVDEKKLTILSGVELSYLDFSAQEIILKSYIEKGKKPSIAQITAFKKLCKDNKLNRQAIGSIMDKRKTSNSVKEYIKLDKSKFSQFADILDNTKNLEQIFLEFLRTQKRMKGGENHAD